MNGQGGKDEEVGKFEGVKEEDGREEDVDSWTSGTWSVHGQK